MSARCGVAGSTLSIEARNLASVVDSKIGGHSATLFRSHCRHLESARQTGTAMRTDNWIDQLKTWSVAELAQRLGLEVFARTNEISFPCPACGKVQRHSKGSDQRKAAKVMPGARWWCEPCGAGGDTVALAAAVVTGTTTPRKERWADIRAVCVQGGLCFGDAHQSRPVRLPTRLQPEAIPEYPPSTELSALWASCGSPSPASLAGAYLNQRGFDLGRLAWTMAIREAPMPPLSMKWWPDSWLHRWPLIFPAFNARGAMVSMHGRAIDREAEPKTRWPYRCNASGLLFADTLGVTFLRCCSQVQSVEGLEAVIIAEGATDTLKLSQVVEAEDSTIAVLGYVAGSKHAVARILWPESVPCIVATDDDDVGDKYAMEIRKAISPTVPVYRVRTPHGRDAEGKKRGDWTDLADDVVRETVANVARWEVCHE